MKLYYTNETAMAEYLEKESKLHQMVEGIPLEVFVNPLEEVSVIERNDKKIAVVPVKGLLLPDAPPIHEMLGNSTYKGIRQALGSALADESIDGVLLDCDSGGGAVAGCIEVAELIAEYPKPLVANIDGLGCSACYKLASSADAIISTKSSNIGNIGAIMTYADMSKLYESMGVEIKAFVSEGASLKSTFHVPSLTEEQEEFLQHNINQAGEVFREHVRKQRKGIDEKVFDARWVTGDEQIKLGLADGIGGVVEALDNLDDKINQIRKQKDRERQKMEATLKNTISK